MNLGTYHLEVSNVERYRWTRGEYPIIVGFTGDKKFDQVTGDESFSGPMNWFRDLNPEVYEMYGGRVVEWKQRR